MFKELAPLLRHRSVLFTVSHLGDDQFRVNVVPRKIGDSENAALTIPVSVSGNGRGSRRTTRGHAGEFCFEPSGTQKHAGPGEGRHGRGRKVGAGRSTRQIEEPGLRRRIQTTRQPQSHPRSKHLSSTSPSRQRPRACSKWRKEPEPIPVAANATPGVEQATRRQLSDEDQEIWAEINAEREYAEEDTDEDPDDAA